MGSGGGYAGGYGPIERSAYATPASLDFKPLAADFLVASGELAYPTDHRINPHNFTPPLAWRGEDWDPGLRFWALPFDDKLTEWLQDLNLAAPAVMAAREFAAEHQKWTYADSTLKAQLTKLQVAQWLQLSDLAWSVDSPDPATTPATAWAVIKNELEELEALMQDSRQAYLAEGWAQADAIPAYFMQLLQLDPNAKPWTAALMRCGLSIGNVAYMYFKARCNRVRPSFLCPGLMPSFGPPQHPAFPSGHAFIGHFVALLLLEVPGVADRYGVDIDVSEGPGRKPVWAEYQAGLKLNGPLLWLAARLARNRERMGLHYLSDSSAGRRLAGGIWNGLFNATPTQPIPMAVPTLQRVLARASAEWV